MAAERLAAVASERDVLKVPLGEQDTQLVLEVPPGEQDMLSGPQKTLPAERCELAALRQPRLGMEGLQRRKVEMQRTLQLERERLQREKDELQRNLQLEKERLQSTLQLKKESWQRILQLRKERLRLEMERTLGSHQLRKPKADEEFYAADFETLGQEDEVERVSFEVKAPDKWRYLHRSRPVLL